MIAKAACAQAVLTVAVLSAVPAVADPTRDVLWLALQACKVNKETTGRSFPCLAVDPGEAERLGTAVMRAPGQRTHVVVIPTRNVVGLEAPELQRTPGNAYWRAALSARHYVTDVLYGALPIEDVAMAVNSRGGRSQDQLHIHLDCVQPSVRAAINGYGARIRSEWAPLPIRLEGNRYFAMRVHADEVEDFNPFAALSRLPGKQTDLRRTSVAMVSSAPGDSAKGMYILAYRAGGSHAEGLLDHACSQVGATAAR